MGDQYWPICRQSFADLHMGLGDCYALESVESMVLDFKGEQ